MELNGSLPQTLLANLPSRTDQYLTHHHHTRHALRFGNQKLNLHQSGQEFEPKAGKVQPGSEDLCFITNHPVDEVLKLWASAGIEVGPN